MTFPNTFDEFAKEYGFNDKEEVYTNGSELIPIFRVKQWLEHIENKTEYEGQMTPGEAACILRESDVIENQNDRETGEPTEQKMALDMAIEALERATWVPVSEKLPKDRDWYLGIFREPDTGWVNPLPFVCDYVGKETKATTKEFWILRGFTDVDDPADYYKNLKCVKWMPLPDYEVE